MYDVLRFVDCLSCVAPQLVDGVWPHASADAIASGIAQLVVAAGLFGSLGAKVSRGQPPSLDAVAVSAPAPTATTPARTPAPKPVPTPPPLPGAARTPGKSLPTPPSQGPGKSGLTLPLPPVIAPRPFPAKETFGWPHAAGSSATPGGRDENAQAPASAGEPATRTDRVAESLADIKHLNRLRAVLHQADTVPWRLHAPDRPKAAEIAVTHGTPIITIANPKGGSGKTTTVANLAAAFVRAGYRTLVIDFDAHAALSRKLVRSAALKHVPAGGADAILQGRTSATWLDETAVGLNAILPGARLITAGTGLDTVEERVFLRWLLDTKPDSDVRYRLAAFLGQVVTGGAFDIVLIDTPPRLSATTINALAASTHVLVPTVLDGLSVEAVRPFLDQVSNWIGKELNPQLRCAGVLAVMTSARNLSSDELRARELLTSALDKTRHTLLSSVVPQRAALQKAAGQDLAYLTDTGRNSVQEIFDLLGAELIHIATRA